MIDEIRQESIRKIRALIKAGWVQTHTYYWLSPDGQLHCGFPSPDGQPALHAGRGVVVTGTTIDTNPKGSSHD